MQISEPAEYALLGLLKARPLHGYELFRRFNTGAIGQIVRLEMSQMYAYLKKLEGMSYVEAEMESQGSRRLRRIFHLTPEGERVFMDWLHEPEEKPRDIRILFLLKLYFLLHFSPTQRSTLITRQIQACERFLTNLETQQQKVPLASSQTEIEPNCLSDEDDTSFLNHVVLPSRIHQTRALLDWLRELQKQPEPAF
jgi:DNA-binding PadR family transcriptional regulator